MEQTPKTFVKPNKIAEICFYLFLFSLFFPVRHVFFTSTTLKTGTFSDFTSISLYLSDILLFFTWLGLFLSRGQTSPRGRTANIGSNIRYFIELLPSSFYFLILWLIIAIFWHFQTFTSLNVYFFLKFLEFIVAYGTIKWLFQETPVKLRFFKLFAALGTVQAGLAVGQFVLQRPLGLYKLGEQQIFVWNQGVAKLIVDSVTYIRGYGTFPHPNPLSAFLLATILILVYLFLQARQTGKRIVYSLMTLMSILGLVCTFSRASFLALAAGLAIFFGFLLFQRAPKINFVPLGTILFGLLLAMVVFKPFLLTRATISDSAALERVFYAKVGWQMIKANPLFGVGVGESVLHMQQYSPVKLLPWQYQPVHNYFELAAAELGIGGALVLAWIFLSHLIRSIKETKIDSTYGLLLACLLLMFLVLMQFDHYFYTLQQTQLLLWLILGIIAATKNPSPYKERGRGESAVKSEIQNPKS